MTLDGLLLNRICLYRLASLGLLVSLTFGQSTRAATLTVGADQIYKAAGDAAQAAQPGDMVLIEEGTYDACAVWRTDNIIIKGLGTGPLFSGTVCEDKAIFVIESNGVKIQNIKFANARSSVGNGAGIRAQGTNLSVDDSVFTNNQDGILSGSNPGSSILVRNSVFEGNGACVTPGACAHGIYAGHIAFLHVEGSHFRNTTIGHHIKSRALRTEIVNNTIEDGKEGSASYLIDNPNGGTLIIRGNVLEKGPRSENHHTAIYIGEEGKLQPSNEILIQDNTFTNDGPPTIFVANKTLTPAQLERNIIKGNPVTTLVGPGTVK